MSEITKIAASFDGYKEEAAKWFEDRIRKAFAAIPVAEDGERYAPKRQVWGKPFSYEDQQNRKAYETCLRFIRHEGGRPSGALSLSDQYLAKIAAQFGEDQVAGFIAKLEGKLGDLEDVTVELRPNAEFTLRGRLGEKSVRVDQQVVFKTSSRGTFFLQWPARIYVDGAFTPEKEYKALAA